MPPLAAGRTSTNDIWMPPPRHPDEQISIGRRRHPDERIFGYPLQALVGTSARILWMDSVSAELSDWRESNYVFFCLLVSDNKI